jgi:hypothetical protein
MDDWEQGRDIYHEVFRQPLRLARVGVSEVWKVREPEERLRCLISGDEDELSVHYVLLLAKRTM